MFNTFSSQKARRGFLSAMINDNNYLALPRAQSLTSSERNKSHDNKLFNICEFELECNKSDVVAGYYVITGL